MSLHHELRVCLLFSIGFLASTFSNASAELVTESSKHYFTSESQLEFTNLELISENEKTITLKFHTSDSLKAEVRYGIADSLANRTLKNSSYSTAHRFVLTNLQVNQTYSLTISGLNTQGDSLISVPITFNPKAYTFSEPVEIQFEEISEYANISVPVDTGYGHGIAVADYDQDGLTDIFVTVYNAPNALYINQGNNKFLEVAAQWDVRGNSTWFDRGCATADYNNDGFPDIFINPAGASAPLFKNTGNGAFIDATNTMNPTDRGRGQGALFADFNHDGLLDLMAINSDGFLGFYLQDEDHSFYDAATAWKVNHLDNNLCALAFDANSDGLIDVYISRQVDNENLMLINKGTYFSNQAWERGVSLRGPESLGIAGGDYDNDGDIDFYVCNDRGSNTLFQNDGNGYFDDVTDAVGLTDDNRSVGAHLVDLNNDGWLDLLMINFGDPNLVYLNDGTGKFTLFNNTGLESPHNGYGSVATDFDLDGDLDVFHSNSGQDNQFFENKTNAGNWLGIELEGTLSNKKAIGAKITTSFNKISQAQSSYSGEAFVSGHVIPFHFGLGNTPFADSIKIEWPSGEKTNLQQVMANQSLKIIEGQPPVYLKKIAKRDSLFPEITLLQIQSESAKTEISAELSLPGFGQIEFGQTPQLGHNVAFGDSLSRSHTASLGPLPQQTFYYYRFHVWDQENTLISTAIDSFETWLPDTTAPDVKAFSIEEITGKSALFRLQTDELSAVGLTLKNNAAQLLSFKNDIFDVSHQFRVNELIESTDYEFYFELKDSSGNTTKSQLYSFQSTEEANLLMADSFDDTQLIHWESKNVPVQSIENSKLYVQNKDTSIAAFQSKASFPSAKAGFRINFANIVDGTYLALVAEHETHADFMTGEKWYRVRFEKQHPLPGFRAIIDWKNAEAADAVPLVERIYDSNSIVQIKLLSGIIRYEIYDSKYQLTAFLERYLPDYGQNASDSLQLAFGIDKPTDDVLQINNVEIVEFAKDPILSALEDSEVDRLPGTFTVSKNYPNPFNPETQFKVAIPESGYLRINVFNISGQMVASLFEKSVMRGSINVEWQGKNSLNQNVSSGIYLLSAQFVSNSGKSHLITRRMTLLK